MSTVSTDFEGLLLQALDEATAAAPQAERDLLRIGSEAAAAVAKVTEGHAILELAPISGASNSEAIYQLILRRRDSQAPASDLGVMRISGTGYPIHRWWTRAGWESRPQVFDQESADEHSLNDFFRWLLSHPASRLVVLVNYIRQQRQIR